MGNKLFAWTAISLFGVGTVHSGRKKEYRVVHYGWEKYLDLAEVSNGPNK